MLSFALVFIEFLYQYSRTTLQSYPKEQILRMFSKNTLKTFMRKSLFHSSSSLSLQFYFNQSHHKYFLDSFFRIFRTTILNKATRRLVHINCRVFFCLNVNLLLSHVNKAMFKPRLN